MITWLGGGDAVLDVGDECLIRIERLGAVKAAKNRIRVAAFMVAGAGCVCLKMGCRILFF